MKRIIKMVPKEECAVHRIFKDLDRYTPIDVHEMRKLKSKPLNESYLFASEPIKMNLSRSYAQRYFDFIYEGQHYKPKKEEPIVTWNL